MKETLKQALIARKKATHEAQIELASEYKTLKERWLSEQKAPAAPKKRLRADRVRLLHLALSEVTPQKLEAEQAPQFIDTNGLVEDAVAADRRRKHENVWTDEELAIFLQR